MFCCVVMFTVFPFCVLLVLWYGFVFGGFVGLSSCYLMLAVWSFNVEF